jgi:hypothetical protein
MTDGSGGYLMSDFELVYLVNELLNSSAARLFDFMSGLFAMVIASYVVGAKLSRSIVWLMAALFSMFAAASIPPAVGSGARLAAVFRQVAQAQSEPGSTLGWVTVPPIPPGIIPWFVAVLLLGAYVGALIFLVQIRREQFRQ